MMNRRQALNVLGLAPSASPEEARAAYRKMAMRHHPDRNPGDSGAEERFKEAKLAYETLAASESSEPLDLSSIFDSNHGDIFSDLFGSIFGRGSSRGVDVWISLEASIRGGEVELDLAAWGEPGVASLSLPPHVSHGSEFMVEISGKARTLKVLVRPPTGWTLSGSVLTQELSLSVLDQVLGVKSLLVNLPDGAKTKVTLPPGLPQHALLELPHPPLAPYVARLRLDFSPELRLNDNERDQIVLIRKALKKREGKNGT